MKHKSITRFTAALVAAISFCYLALPTSAAWIGIGAGDVNGARFTYNNTPYGYFTGSDQFAWRVNMYVSANEDGKINKDRDTVGSTYLPLVGSLLCTGDKWVTSTVGNTYIQTNYTDIRLNLTEGYSTVTDSEGNITTKYILPTMQEFEYGSGVYDSYTPNGDKCTVAIAKKDSIPLFKGQYNTELNFTTISNNLTGDDAGKYTADILKQLLDESKGGDVFINVNLPKALNQKIKDDFKAKAAAMPAGSTSTDAVFKYLLPYNPATGETNNECMVEWAMVITPIYRFECKVPFYCYDIYGNDQQFGSPSANVNAALDAYWFAQYNETSKALSKAGYFPGNYTKQDGTIGSIANSSIGMLAFWLDNSAGKAANAAYCLENVDRYLGVYTNVNNNTTIDRWASLLKTTPYGPSEYAKRGGITVFTTKITTPEAPVYYHTYTYEIDENNQPDGYTVGTSYTQSDLIKFTKELTPKVTVTKGSKSPEGDFYTPATDTEALEKGVPVAAMTPHPTVNPQPGDSSEEYPTPILFN